LTRWRCHKQIEQ